MYARIQNNRPVEWPVLDIRARFPNTSFPAVITQQALPDGWVEVHAAPQPAYDPISQELQDAEPVLVNGQWQQGYAVADRDPAVVAANQAAAKQALQDGIVAATQQRLDDFAKTRNYDGILSACTYSDSLVQKFRTEGQYCLAQRDATWAKLYEILSEVEAGTRPAPAGYTDIEPDLPPLVWPNP